MFGPLTWSSLLVLCYVKSPDSQSIAVAMSLYRIISVILCHPDFDCHRETWPSWNTGRVVTGSFLHTNLLLINFTDNFTNFLGREDWVTTTLLHVATYDYLFIVFSSTMGPRNCKNISALGRTWLVVTTSIDNRPTEKGLETRNFLAVSHSGARYDHVI